MREKVHNPLEGDRPELQIDLHDGSEEQISIIVVHKDRPEYLNMCLQSITTNSFNSNYEIIVVDNASGKDSQEFLDDIEEEVKVIRNNKNLYWSAAANKGAEAASKNSKYLMFMHCDVVVLNPGWLDLFINVCESQGCGMVGVELKSYFVQDQKMDFIEEWCMIVTRDCWNQCGPFIEELPQIGHSFIFTLKAQRAGYKPQVMNTNVCHHYKIFSLNINEYEKFVESAMSQIPKYIKQMQEVQKV